MWRRASSTGALATLLVGSLLGVTVFLLDWFKDDTGWNTPFMMSAFYLFVACSAVLVSVSLWKPDTAAVADARQSLSWRNPLEALRGDSWRWLGDFRVLAFVLFVTMVLLYFVFA
jgi:SSS family solute:Na+ symporter